MYRGVTVSLCRGRRARESARVPGVHRCLLVGYGGIEITNVRFQSDRAPTVPACVYIYTRSATSLYVCMYVCVEVYIAAAAAAAANQAAINRLAD